MKNAAAPYPLPRPASRFSARPAVQQPPLPPGFPVLSPLPALNQRRAHPRRRDPLPPPPPPKGLGAEEDAQQWLPLCLLEALDLTAWGCRPHTIPAVARA